MTPIYSWTLNFNYNRHVINKSMKYMYDQVLFESGCAIREFEYQS